MKPKRPSHATQAQAPAASPVAGPAAPRVRGSLRLLGWLLALAPWVFAPAALSLDPLDELKTLAVSAGLAACLFLLLREERRHPLPALPWRRFLAEPYHAGAALILAGLILSALFSPVPGLGLLAALPNLLYVAFALCLALRPPAAAEVRWILLCLFATMILQSLLALAQYFLPRAVEILLPFAVPARAGRDSMIGTLGNPEYLAGWLTAGLGAALAILWRGGRHAERGAASLLRDPLGLAAAVLAAAACGVIFIGGSRGALLATAGALLLARAASGGITPGAGAPPPSRHRFKVALAAGAALLGLLFVIWALQAPTGRKNTLPGRLADLANLHSPSMRHRIGLLAITSHIIREHPLLGVGPGRYGWAYGEMQGRLASRESGIGYWALGEVLAGNYVGEAHCDPLQWWAEYGLLPLLGLTLMIARALSAAAAKTTGHGASRRLAGQPLGGALWVALAALALDMWVAFPLQRPIRSLTFWVLLGLVAALMREKENA